MLKLTVTSKLRRPFKRPVGLSTTFIIIVTILLLCLCSYWKRPLTLAELTAELENDDTVEVPNNVFIFPPVNANDCITDEDSGDDDNVIIDNLPGSQLKAESEMTANNYLDQFDSGDELPLARLVVPKPKKFKEFRYSKQDLQSNFSEWTSVQTATNQQSPASLFKQFFSDEVIEQITQFSNKYALQKNCPGDITQNEILCFIGVLLLSGYCSVSRRKMYWENAHDTQNKLVSEAITRDRFQYIMKHIHCCDNTQLDKNDKFSKMRPLFDSLNKNFFEYAPVEENHSIDEAMVPYFGRHGCKQFIRGKPIRWGYKFWVGTTRLGYIIFFDPYQGSSSRLPQQYCHLGLGSAVVLQYADVLQKMPFGPFHLFFDNYFTSLSLLKELRIRNIRGTGTIRENRIPRSPLSDSKQMKKSTRGNYDYALVDDDLVICKWNDNSVVTLASNAASVFPLNKAKRFSQTEKKHILVDQPSLVKLYNENMGGVDRSDQNIGQYRINIRGKKWYFPLLTHAIDMAVQNAWHLHKRNFGTLDQLAFRRSITTELLETYRRTTKRGPSRSSKNLHEHSRYDGNAHLIIYRENQLRCALCHKKVNFACSKCEIGLHPKHCFYIYHTPQ